MNAYVFGSALDRDSTDFNIDAAIGLSQKPLKSDEILTLIGRPAGEVRFPSLLLKKTLGTMPEAVPPPNASAAILHLYGETKMEYGVNNTYFKLLIFFLQADGSTIERRYFKGIL